MTLTLRLAGGPHRLKASDLNVKLTGWDPSAAPMVWVGTTPTSATPANAAALNSGGAGLLPLGQIDHITASLVDGLVSASLRFAYGVLGWQASDNYLWVCIGAQDGGSFAATAKLAIRA